MDYGGCSGRRFKRQTLSKNGDVVIVSASRNHYQALRLEAGKILNNKFGHFSHDDMIGQRFGSWIKSRSNKNGRSNQRNHKKKSKPEQKSTDANDTSSNVQLPQKRKHSELAEKAKLTRKYGEMCLLRPSCELWTLALSHRTQILYDADKSLIIYLLQIKPNDVVYESGTGSGSLSTSFSRTISPFGQLFTFEFNPLRADYARNDFKNLLIDTLITVIHRNIVQNGFPNKQKLLEIMQNIVTQHANLNEKLAQNESNEDSDLDASSAKNKKRNVSQYRDSFGSSTNKIDKNAWLTDEKIKNIKHWISTLQASKKEEFVNGVFLDLPKPFDAIKSAYKVLKYNGKICSFSPCIEQVQKTCEVLSKNGFVDIRTFEVLSRDHLIRNHSFPALDLNTNNSIHAIRSRPNSERKADLAENCETEMITSRPVGKTFGHTGYLTFALKALNK